MLRKANVYFFGEEEVSAHDAIWLYGGYSVFIAIPAITLLSII